MKKLFILLAAVAFVVAYTVPAVAAEWNFYGSARMTTFMDDDSKEASGTGFDDDDLTWTLQSNSRIGANVKAGDIGGRFEYGTGINLRLLYGTWNFGGGTLEIGQDYTPLFYLVSNQVWGSDNDLVNYGGVYAGRRPMIQLSFGGFKIALVQPNTSTTLAGYAVADTDTSVPKIEACYTFKAGPLSLKPMFGYNTYDVVDATDKDESVDSYIAALGATVALGPAYIKGSVYTGQNLGQYGFLIGTASSAAYDAVDNKVVDNDSMGYQLIVGFKAGDTITVEAGYGYVESELDVAGSEKDDACSYYVNATINLAKGCFIVPEIGKVDYKEDSAKVDEGDKTYYGAKWQINF